MTRDPADRWSIAAAQEFLEAGPDQATARSPAACRAARWQAGRTSGSERAPGCMPLPTRTAAPPPSTATHDAHGAEAGRRPDRTGPQRRRWSWSWLAALAVVP